MDNYSIELKINNIIRIIHVDPSSDGKQEFLNWYNAEHEHMLLKVPGVIWTYRGCNFNNRGPEYLFMYLISDPIVMESEQYKAASQTEWARDVRPLLKTFQSKNYETLLGGYAPTRFKPGSVIRLLHLVGKKGHASTLDEFAVNRYYPDICKINPSAKIWMAKNISDENYELAVIIFLSRTEYSTASGVEAYRSIFQDNLEYFCEDFEIQL